MLQNTTQAGSIPKCRFPFGEQGCRGTLGACINHRSVHMCIPLDGSMDPDELWPHDGEQYRPNFPAKSLIYNIPCTPALLVFD